MSVLRSLLSSGVIFRPLYEGEGAGGGGGDGGGSGGKVDSGAAAPSAGAGAPAAAAAGGGDGGASGAGAAAAGGGAGAAAVGGGEGAAAAAAAAGAVKPGGLPDGFDFRAYLANGDDKAVKDLEKYTDPRAVYTTLRDLQAKISRGELKAPPAPLPDNATAEQKAAWRQANGLPSTAEDYVKGLQLPNGLVIGEADRPLVESFAKSMFEAGATQAEMNRAVNWFYATQDAQAQARADADGQFRVDSEVALKQEWGPEHKRNMAAFGAFKEQLPQEMQELVFKARTADGHVLGNHPEFIKIGAKLGLELNPAATVITENGGGNFAGVEARIKEIKGMMYDGKGTANPAYWQNEALQAEYRGLIETQQRLQAKGKAA